MNFKKWVAVLSGAALLASCGENSSKGADKDARDTANSVTTAPPENTPVNTTVEVPEATRTSFQTKYPKATSVTWSRYEPVDWFDWEWAGWPVLDSGDYVVKYTDDGVEYWGFYDNNNWVGTTTVIGDQSGLPAPVSKAVNDHFPGYTIKTIRKENDKDRTAYEIKLEKGTDKAKILVAENGSVMKKTTNVDGTKTKEKNT